MDCPTCIPVLEKEVGQLAGVSEVKGNYLNKTLKVTYDPRKVQLEKIETTIEQVGYRIAYKKYPSVVSKLTRVFQGMKAREIPSLTDTDFSSKVLPASKPVVVLFSSPTCPACHIFKRKFKELATNVNGKATVYEMDIASTETWRKYNILSIPSVLIFRNGQLIERFEAFPKLEEIASFIGLK
jgi:thioredoxin 1